MMPREKRYLQAFFALLRAGLWVKDARLSSLGRLDYSEVMRLAEEQSVVGLVTAGLERVADVKVPKEELLQFIGATLQIEEQNRTLNLFVADLVEQLRKVGVYTLLVKGQGIAQCYERPLWRSSGDIDLFLSEDNYKKAKDYLLPLATSVEPEAISTKHLGMTIESQVVELHGTMRSGVLSRIDKEVDEVQGDVFYGGNVRSWMNGKTSVFLPAPDNDVVFVFTHILKHFFKSGIGLRQICDWCRLLWVYKDSINHKLLERRIRKMGMMTEWKAFASLAVDVLGMPMDAMPFYEHNSRWKKKANRILIFILDTGNFGQNRDLSYFSKKPYIIRKLISFWWHTRNGMQRFFLFPLDSVLVWLRVLTGGVSAVVRREG